jgi:antitoxin component YwqK of YwqJK toxin-antitoxin module
MVKTFIIIIITILGFGIQKGYAQEGWSVTQQESEMFIDTISYELLSGIPDGSYSIYRDSLKKDLFSCGPILNGVKSGSWKWFAKSGGLLREIQYSGGRQNGSHISYYPNGQKSMVMTYIGGVKDGKVLRWYSNGIKSLEGSYSNNKPSGIWTRWDEQGVEISTTNY